LGLIIRTALSSWVTHVPLLQSVAFTALTCIQPLDSGQVTDRSRSTSRWYHDSVSNSCRSFSYAGIGGNSNNFLTREHCESYCVFSESFYPSCRT
uniref:BPTI/Kunitz inhibitor domain-containing protein n=1 Tax=Heligmosomoides polygyrus TaxID=6339 RepID=A0A183GLS4_HELPZ